MISLSPPTICNSARKTTLRKQPSEKATFISFFSGHKGGGNYSLHGYSQGFR
ncbi:hypothetical protein J460_4156 [Acinetobacter baumannii 942133]|uniref:Uncharacterized protein n=21 Tax=Pseudomonadota TaxID=1224 RepID=A0A222ZEZ8_CITFR|nr:Hypothetical protein [Citrobacter freundii]EXD72139.1 hypothetical protein J460_4156 [Acinetobacter baumannii 942133]QGJ80064.1 Hypothetical protein [Klebsiella pneumoniae]QGJ80236.1 Hypothetical protein [Klebsiella pneumoniae]